MNRQTRQHIIRQYLYRYASWPRSVHLTLWISVTSITVLINYLCIVLPTHQAYRQQQSHQHAIHKQWQQLNNEKKQCQQQQLLEKKHPLLKIAKKNAWPDPLPLLQKALTQHHLTLTQITPPDTTDQPALTLTFQGGYQDSMHLLTHWHDTLPLVWIHAITIRREPHTPPGATPPLTVTLQLETL